MLQKSWNNLKKKNNLWTASDLLQLSFLSVHIMTSHFSKGFVIISDGGGESFTSTVKGHSWVLIWWFPGWFWWLGMNRRVLRNTYVTTLTLHVWAMSLARHRSSRAISWFLRRSAKRLTFSVNLKRLSHHLKTQSAELATILKCRPCTGGWHNSSCLIIVELLKFWR